MPAALSLTVILSFIASIALQVVSLAVMPMTAGYTKPLPTLFCVVTFAVAIGLLARIIASGVQLSILIPLSSASVPIATVLVGVIFYHEPASLLRIAVLLGACGLIAVASNL
jgi:hypothetical protein